MAISSPLTVVMYHYVRPLAESAFPRLKALELAAFNEQLDYLDRNYTVISPQTLEAALHNEGQLPNRPCLLTFDDGYSDHYEHVFPALQNRGFNGLFFAPKMSLIDRQMLEVNKVQFVLASSDTPDKLATELDTFLRENTSIDVAPLRAAHFSPNRYDGPEVAYFKRLLQHALPASLRSTAVDHMFTRHVAADVADFAEALYLTPEQAMEMREAGNEFGGHGDRHLWHAEASASELEGEVAGSVEALNAIGAPSTGGYYCYPFGNQNKAVRDAIAKAGFTTAFTVVPQLYPLSSKESLQICRLDTNDLPRIPDTQNDPWLQAASIT